MTIDRYAHLVGGARMGFTSADSVVDSDHRVWGVPNLFIVDGSVFPTEGAANPALVIMALADRCAERLARKRLA
jgi:choline dehydrogenase-like flavoprotein